MSLLVSKKCKVKSVKSKDENFELSTLNFQHYRYLGAYIGGVHLFPFRTEKLSPPEPMVLQ